MLDTIAAPSHVRSPLSPRRKRTPDYLPEDYSDLFTNYYAYVSSLVFGAGIDPQNVEDVTMAILTKFFENDVLADYDPDHTTSHGGVTRKAVFRTFLSGFVKLYVRHYRERQTTTSNREPLLCNQPVRDGSNSFGETDWVELFGPPVVESYDDLQMGDAISTVRARLADLPGDSKCSIADLFEAVLAHLRDYGKPDIAQLANQFEVSQTTVRVRLARLKDEMHVAFDWDLDEE